MIIGYFSSTFPYNHSHPDYFCGGSSLATHSLVNEISNRDTDVKVFTTSADSGDHYEQKGRIEIYRYATSLKLFTSPLSLGLFHKPLKHGVDLVHVSFDMPPGPFAASRYARKKDLPLILTYHGDWDPDYGSFARKVGVSINNRFVSDLLSYADLIISPSKLYAEKSRYLNKYPDKIRVIPNGIDVDEFQLNYSQEECREKLNLPPECKIILFFGYLTPYKGPDILLRVFREILKNHPNTILLFAGNGNMEVELEKLAKQWNIQDKVIFSGFVEKERRSLYYRAADIFCLPSTMSTECYPLAILEAMASGVPVVASDIGGIPDIIENNVNGFLVQPKDEEKLEDALNLLLQNPETCEKFSENALEGIRKYSWENIATETLKLYEVLLQDR